MKGKLVLLQEEWYGFCYPAMLRGIAEISGGTVCYALSKYLREQVGPRLTPAGRSAFTAAELLLWAAAILQVFLHVQRGEQIFLLVLFIIGVSMLMSGLGNTSRLFAHPFFGWLGKVSLGVYLAQDFAFRLAPSGWTELGMRGVLLYLPLAFLVGVLAWGSGRLLAKAFGLLCRRAAGPFIKPAA